MASTATKSSATEDAARPGADSGLADTPDRAWGLAGALAVLLGVVFRLAEYLGSRSLWADEARLALNIVDKSYAQLLGPLDENQAAPIGFLVATKRLTETFGFGEGVLRAIPFAAGVLTLPLVWLAGRELAGKRGAAIAASLVAVSEPLIYYSNEFKQYSVDAFLCVSLVWLGMRAERRGKAVDWLSLCVAGSVALPLSHPAVFVCAGVGLSLLTSVWRRRGTRGFVAPATVSIVWLVCFLALYAFVIRHVSNSVYLRTFWGGAFPTQSPAWWIDVALGLFADPVGLTSTGLAAVCAIAGGAVLWRGRRHELALVVMPVVLVIVAAVCRLYPLRHPLPFAYPPAGRLVLFIAPLLALLVAVGVEGWRLRGEKLGAWFAPLIWCLLMLQPLTKAIDRTLHPPQRQELRQLLDAVAEHARPEDRVLLYWQAEPAYRFYLPRTKARDRLTSPPHLLPSHGTWLDYEDDLEAVAKPGRRVWVIYVTHPDWTAASERDAVMLLCSRMSRPVTQITAPGASAMLVEIVAGGTGP